MLRSLIVIAFGMSAWLALTQVAVSQRPSPSTTAAESEAARHIAPEPQEPFGPLPKAHQDYLDNVLSYWEHSSKQIQRYRCKFTRWQYDPVFGPGADPTTGVVPAKTIATGIIKYAEPDKGMYEVEKLYHYVPPQQLDEKSKYLIKSEDDKEQWICDGHWIYEFDYARKKIFERELPPELRGQSITDGPLPFLFGAKADDIKQRYWVRVITPKGQTGEYWLEAWPKRREDAANYKKVEIIIAEEDFLPKGIQIFDVNYDPRKNPARTAFTFEDREINFNDRSPLDPLGLFSRAFHKPKTPSGWDRETFKYQQSQRPDELDADLDDSRANSARRPANLGLPR